MSKTHFIQKAIKHPGALTAKANTVGESPMQFAQQHEHDSGQTGAQARFALVLKHLNHAHGGGHPAPSGHVQPLRVP